MADRVGGLWEAMKAMQGPLGNAGKDFRLNGGQICILEGSSGCCVNKLDQSKLVRRHTNIQADDEGKSVLRGREKVERFE